MDSVASVVGVVVSSGSLTAHAAKLAQRAQIISAIHKFFIRMPPGVFVIIHNKPLLVNSSVKRSPNRCLQLENRVIS